MEVKRMVRTTGWIAAGLAGLLVIAWWALLGINRNDEAPSADAMRLEAMSGDREALADAANAFARMGELASGHAGRQAARSAGVAEVVVACREPVACREALRAHPDAPLQWQATEPALLQHYSDMLSAQAWQEPLITDPMAPLMDFSAALEAQALHLLTARQQAIAGDAAAVRDALESDLVFWRRVMASSDLLLTRMVAVAAIERHFQLGQLALRELPPSSALEAVPASWARPLGKEERSLMRPIAGEWRLVQAGLRSAVSPGAAEAHSRWTSRLARPLLQPQATLNLVAGQLVELGALSTQPWPELARAVRGLREAADAATPGLAVYNPIGRMLAAPQARSAPAYADYIARGADLEGLRRVSLLVATLRSQGVRPGAMPDAVRKARLRNPYDDAPFAWDAEAGGVVFEGLAWGDRGRHIVRP